MKRNCLKSDLGRSLFFLSAFFLLIVLGVIQPYASEEVMHYTSSDILAKNKVMGLLPMMSSRNEKLPDMFPKPSALSKKLQQLEQNPQYLKAPLPAERVLSRPFSELLAREEGRERNVDQESSDVPARFRGVVSRALPHEPDEVIVKFKPYTSSSASEFVLSTIGMQKVKHYELVDVHLTKTSPGMKVKEAIETLKKNPAVEYAEPNYVWHASATLPNDPDFGLQWGLHNTGQTGGTNDADIDAPEAWDLETGSSDVVIAVIDTGVDYNHVDLADNMWTNPGEIPGDAIDNDGNGYVDDVYGINSIDGSGDPMDDAADVYHGTHCAGIIAGVGSNSTGITGVCWTAKIMALKFLNEGGSGWTSDAIECVEYMVNMKNTYGVNVKVSSNSWGGGGYSAALEGAINLAGDSGIIFVASAGNAGRNNDISPHYPDGYDCLNIISVGASDHNDALAGFSQYGYNSVDVAAPGVSIWSAKRGDDYQYLGGTSMAAPHVSGLAGLIFSNNPAYSPLEVKEKIFRTVDTKSNLEDVIASGGRINAYNALTASIPPGPFIYSLSPGFAAYGDRITIEGTDFGIGQGLGSVTFSNNVTSPIISWSDNQIATTVPDGCQTGPVTVTTDGGLVSNGKILTLAGSISGTVSEENTGNPVEGVYIDVYDTDGYRISSVYSPTGDYSVKLPTGNYYVRTFALTCHIDEWYQDAVPWESDPPPVSVVAPDNTPNINFVLELGGSISGRITAEQSGNPLYPVSVAVYDSNGGGVSYIGTLYLNGDYTVCKLPTGDYYARTYNDQGYIDEWYQGAEPGSSPPPIHVEAPNDTPNINFALDKGGCIAGVVADSTTGDPLGNVAVDVYDSNGNSISRYNWSDAEGHYTVDGLATGEYYVHTYNDQGYIDEWYQGAEPGSGAPPVHVEAPDCTYNIDFVLEEGGSISGRIVDQTGAAIETYVNVYDGNGNSMGYDWTDPEGNYTANGLPTGDYFVRTYDYYCNRSVWYQGAVPWEGDLPPVHVEAPNDTPNINFTLGEGGSISGQIVDQTGAPVEGVEVDVMDSSGNYVGYAWSDPGGNYTAGCLPTGDYYLRTWNDRGYIDEYYLDAVPGEGDPPPVHVDAPGNTPDINFTLGEGGSISGRVVDPTGVAIETSVYVYDGNGNYMGYDRSNPEGHYTVNGLPTGDYYVSTNDDYCNREEWYQDAVPWEGSPPPVHVEVPDDTPDINFVLREGGSISGLVTVDPTGEPIARVRIRVYDSNGNTMGYDWSDSAGRYTVGCLPTGDYYVRTQNSKGYLDEWYQDAVPEEGDLPPVHVDAPNETSDINFVLEKGGSISGQIVDPTGVAIETSVNVYDSNGNTMGYDWSDSEGHYTVNGLPTGDYYVNTYDDYCNREEWYQDAVPWEADPPPVHVEVPDDTPDINFVLRGGGSISGLVTVDSTGEPLGHVEVDVYDSDGNWISRYGWSDSIGHYTVGCLPTGDYYVQTWNDQGYLDEWYQGAVPWEGDPPPVHVDAPDDTPDINFVLEEGGSISGRIVDQTGVAIATYVYVYDGNGNYMGNDRSDPEGHYTVNGLPTGNYYVNTYDNYCNRDVWYQDVIPWEGSPPPVHVEAPDDTPDINFVLREGGSISGLVTVDPTGEPIGNVRVGVYDSNGNTMGYAWSNSIGHYTVGCLPTGDYYVRTRDSEGYLGEWYQDADPELGDPPPVHVDAPDDTPDIDFALEEGGSISGHVFDSTILPIRRVDVFIYDRNGNSLGYDWSDSEGHYTVNTLPTGDYYVRTRNNQGYIDEWYQDADPGEGDPPPVYVDAPHRTPDINFVLEEGGSISGLVTAEPTGDPIGNVGINVYDTNGNPIGYDGSDPEGHYTVNGLPTGDYYVLTQNQGNYVGEWYQGAEPGSDPPPVHVDAPNDTPGINFTMIPGGSVSGTITCENCSGGQIISFALSERLEPDFSNLLDKLISLGYIEGQAESSPYTLTGLPYDTPVWIYAWWSNQFNFPPEAGDYFGSYEANPIFLREVNPDLTEIDIHLKEICESDNDCDGICNPGESSPSCNGSDNCTYDYNPNQEDNYPPQGNGLGDVCDCECNFDCDSDVDADDVATFIADFGRFEFNNPCANDDHCNGDCECDGDVDAVDVEKFMEDFGRNHFNNPCPACEVGDWCVY